MGWLVVGVTGLAVLAPAVTGGGDSYPLSSYPMFSRDRGEEAHLATAVAESASGEVWRLDPETISGSDEVILAAATVARAIRGGRVEALCREIADRIDDPEARHVVVRTEQHDLVASLTDGAEPLAVEEHARCEVTP